MAMAMVMIKLNNHRIGKIVLLLWLSGHVASFIVLSPLQLWLSIPLCLILLAYIIWSMGILQKPIPAIVVDDDIPPELSPGLQDEIYPQDSDNTEVLQVDKQPEQ